MTKVECYHSGTYAMDEANYLFLENHITELDPDTRYIKMHGRTNLH
jgi:3-oxoacyl-[acyl-carrier-protein] synthase-3